ncbi:MAG: hypothetical protein ABJO57_00725 [Lentilitoribacter sp.]
MTIKRHKQNQREKNFAWALLAIALVMCLPFDDGEHQQDAEFANYQYKMDGTSVISVDPITTASLRGSKLVHAVSNKDLVRLANADVQLQAAYSDDQLQEKIYQLNELDASQSKCFRVTPYEISTSRSEDWKDLNYKLLSSYIDQGMPENTPVSREQIMAEIWLVREAALQAEGTPQRFRTFGLYLLQVQNTLIDAHQYYGDDGFKWAQKLVQTEYDWELAEHIQQILPSEFYTRRLNQNMQLFSHDVSKFIPCSIRAKQLLQQKSSSS